MEDLDPEFYKNLKWLLDTDVGDEGMSGIYFCYEEDEFGKMKVIDLI